MISGDTTDRGKLLHLAERRPSDRHVLVAVSHPSNNPAQHRTFQVRASFDPGKQGWVARVREQNHNDQSGEWLKLEAGPETVFATAPLCLGGATAAIVALCDIEDYAP